MLYWDGIYFDIILLFIRYRIYVFILFFRLDIVYFREILGDYIIGSGNFI